MLDKTKNSSFRSTPALSIDAAVKRYATSAMPTNRAGLRYLEPDGAVEPRTEWIIVTPEMADEWLRTRNTWNRVIHRPPLLKYVRGLRSGQWHQSHQGIAFFHNGVLHDGQHRLIAIVIAGIPVCMPVTFGLPMDAALGTDQHLRRSIADIGRTSGSGRWLTNPIVAITNACLAPNNSAWRSHSPEDIIACANAHSDAIQLARELCKIKRHGIGSAAVASVYALALDAGEPLGRIEEFADDMASGEIQDHTDNAVLKVRDFCLQHRLLGRDGQYQAQLRVGWGLMKFIAHTPIQVLHAPQELPYPWFTIPDHKTDEEG